MIAKPHREIAAGLLVLLIGIGAIVEGRQNDLGTLRQLGPGFFPVALGVLTALVGILILAPALLAKTADPRLASRQPADWKPDWRGWGCIILSPLLFILFATLAGLLPATFVCVFVAALGSRTTSLKAAATLAVAISVVGVFVFGYLLQVTIPILALRLP